MSSENDAEVNLSPALAGIRLRIAACNGVQKTQVVAVTKGFGAHAVVAAMEAGLTAVGENYAQELLAKDAELNKRGLSRPDWHFIGRLQRRKVRQLAGIVKVWQSVDSKPLLEEIAKRDPGARVLVQVNLSDDLGRGGATSEEAPDLVGYGRDIGLDVAGLMAIAPIGHVEEARRGFRTVAQVAAELRLAEVSTGMSDDFEIAVEEGSTMVRIGSALFGARPQPPAGGG